jgi:catechol 2,3-dioxygenase-like lactoylglutathione lyase family enzyme
MQKVTGIGGVFFRAKDPMVLSAWYEQHLGINGMSENGSLWIQQRGPTVFAPFPADTNYFGDGSRSFMFNFCVDDLDAMLAQLRAADVKTVKDIEEQVGIGRFAWIEDPEGNRIELWEPKIDMEVAKAAVTKPSFDGKAS